MLAFFYALHPNKNPSSTDTSPYQNPSDILQVLIAQFGAVSGTAAVVADTGPNNVGAAPTQTGA